jgi:hypothetical protein
MGKREGEKRHQTVSTTDLLFCHLAAKLPVG